MKKLQTLLSVILSGLFGILVFAGLTLIGMLVFDSTKGFWGVVGFTFFGLAGMSLGYLVAKASRRRGILEFIAAVQATPELDQLEPGPDSDCRKLNAEDYALKYNADDLVCIGGQVRIWGDFRSRQLDSFNEISSVAYQPPGILILSFSNGNSVSLKDPGIVFEASSYLKITDATEITWKWTENHPVKDLYFRYQKEGNTIRTQTSSDWESRDLDVLAGLPALFISNGG
ncbi:MAG: hypothetical protein JW801_10580 [Bacteroidales bacterium]|nr:hypothetical protein [Bacteroidales bacterium]